MQRDPSSLDGIDYRAPGRRWLGSAVPRLTPIAPNPRLVMTPDRQHELICRIRKHQQNGKATDTADQVMRVGALDFTDADRFKREARLLETTPQLVGLSGLVPEPNTFVTVQLAGRSVILTRDSQGVAHALLNVCSHRGAEVASGCGSTRVLTCPYHSWTFNLDGQLRGRRRPEYFDDEPPRGLTPLPVIEVNGRLWITATPSKATPGEALSGAEVELDPLDLGGYRHFETTSFEREVNWKQPVETFCEAYHVASLHRHSLSPLIHSDFALFDAFGPHGRMIAVRRSIDDIDETETPDDPLLPHATILWFIAPNTVLIHQQDHIELFRSEPAGSPDRATLTISMYVPKDATAPDRYWRRNMDLLIEVTDTEDFATAAGIQRGMRSGAHPGIVIGRNEPALQHYHRSVADLVSES